jgi:RNA polymerase sigma-70 factor, ECF subfamily
VDRAADAAPGVVPPLVDRLFREEAGRLTALLTRLVGPAHLALAEDVVQEAFIAALRHWPMSGVPRNPSAWLLQVARRKALDALRRDRMLTELAPRIGAELDAAVEAAGDATAHPIDGAAADDPFADDQLRMILLCCHPAVSAESRVALALKLVSGFSAGEIARAFLADERAVAQRLVRAKRALRDADATFDMPEGDALIARLDAVHDVLYLMFNEGHTAHDGEALLRRDLCEEALRLCERLLCDARTTSPTTHALAALFYFHSSRFDARTGVDGMPVRLAEQDRTRWDQARIVRGFAHLESAAEGERITPYHVEAQIASLHAMAPSLDQTDWSRIVAAYDRLLALAPSPVVALNRIVALQQAEGAERAWREMRPLMKDPTLERYALTHAVRATLLVALGRSDEARSAWQEARALTPSLPLQRQADQRLGELDALLLTRDRALDVDSAPPRPS